MSKRIFLHFYSKGILCSCSLVTALSPRLRVKNKSKHFFFILSDILGAFISLALVQESIRTLTFGRRVGKLLKSLDSLKAEDGSLQAS